MEPPTRPSSSRPRSSSISRSVIASDFLSRRDPEFTPHDALQLASRLQALDSQLRLVPVEKHSELDFGSILQKSDLETHEDKEGYAPLEYSVIRELHQYVSSLKIWHSNSIPDTFAKGYRAGLAGQTWTNDYSIANFFKGRSCSSSDALQALPEIERLLGTNLCSQFVAVHDTVKPFPFLKLPAELRLQIYSYLLPRAPCIVLLRRPVRKWAPLKFNLNLLRACHQTHAEASKFFYEGRTLIVHLVRGQGFEPLDHHVLTALYELVANMNPQTRALFKKIEFPVDFLAPDASTAKRYLHIKEVDEPFPAMLALLPNVETFLVSFPWRGSMAINSRPDTSRIKAAEFLADSIPNDKELLWDFTFWGDEAGERSVTEKMQDRGGIRFHSSTTHVYKRKLPSV